MNTGTERDSQCVERRILRGSGDPPLPCQVAEGALDIAIRQRHRQGTCCGRARCLASR